MDFHETPYVELNTQPLTTAQVCLDSVNNEEHFTPPRMYLGLHSRDFTEIPLLEFKALSAVSPLTFKVFFLKCHI